MQQYAKGKQRFKTSFMHYHKKIITFISPAAQTTFLAVQVDQNWA